MKVHSVLLLPGYRDFAQCCIHDKFKFDEYTRNAEIEIALRIVAIK